MNDENKRPNSVQAETIRCAVDAYVALQAAIERGGYDVSPCLICQEQVVCSANGLAVCKHCAKKASQ